MGDKPGLSRRQMIKASAAAGAVAWTAPMIVDSLASPAAAASGGGLPTGCSYALFVFSVSGQGPYIGRIQQGSASCTFTNSTSNDSSFNSFVCNGHTYQGGSAYGAVIQQDGVTVPGYNVGTCDQLFTVQGSTIVEDSPGTATILFAVSHHGGSGGWQGSKFFPVCPAPSDTSVTVDCN
jgi:hypothetical protein